MTIYARFLVVVAVLCFCSPASAETATVTNGSDTFVSGAQVNEVLDAGGDGFMAGRYVQASGMARGDLHVSGFDVSVSADVAEDLYAAGATVVISGTVTQDLTAAAFTLRTQASSKTGGNARLMGNTVTLNGPVSGAVAILGRDVILNSTIAGDVRITAQTLSFGPDAVISGTLSYAAPEKVTVPERVAAAERVSFEKLTGGRMWEEWDDIGKEMPVLPSFASMIMGFVISLLFFLVLGALMLAFMPKRLSRMRKSIAQAPGQTIILGVVGLSMLIGMVPIIAMTIIGLPFVPIVILLIVATWTLGYALGAYSIGMRIWAGLGGDVDPGNIARLLVLAGAIICVALLNFIPFVGWVVNYTLVLLGIGAMTRAVFQSMLGNPDVALDVDLKPIED